VSIEDINLNKMDREWEYVDVNDIHNKALIITSTTELAPADYEHLFHFVLPVYTKGAST